MLTHEKKTQKNGNVSTGERLGECRNGNGCGRRTAMHGKTVKTKSTLYARVKTSRNENENDKKKTWNRKNRTNV